MRTPFLALVFLAIPVAGIVAEPTGCPGIEGAAKAYIAANFATDEEKAANVQQKTFPLTQHASALQIFVPPEPDEKDAAPRAYLAFFSGENQCEFVQQWDGELAETIDAGATTKTAT